MSVNFVPIEQIIPALVTGQAISSGTTDPVVINKRAQTALAVAKTFTDIAAGNAAAAQADFSAIITDPNMDPVVAFELQQALALALQQLSVANSLGNLVPIFGATALAIVTNVAAGITTGANLEIVAHPLPTPPASPPA